MADVLSHPVVDWLCGAALVFLIGSGVIAGLVSDLRERRFRRLCAQRSAFADNEWVEQFCPEWVEFGPLIRGVIKVIGEVYGVPPGTLRPDDDLEFDYGFLKPLILDEPFSLVPDRLRRELPGTIKFPARWELPSPTVNGVIRYIIALARDRRPSSR